MTTEDERPTATDNARAVREFTLRIFTVIVDNEKEAAGELKAAAREQMEHYGITTAEDMKEALAGRGPYTERELDALAGVEVTDVIRGWIAAEKRAAEYREDTRPFLMLMLGDLLDMGDTVFAADLGHHYLPDPDDFPA